MASFTSILSDIGSFLKKVFTGAAELATLAEPIIDVALPGIAPLYNVTVSAVIAAETAAIAAGNQNGSGAQKLQYVVNAIETDFNAFLTANGLPAATAATIEGYINAVVASLNAIPAAPKS